MVPDNPQIGEGNGMITITAIFLLVVLPTMILVLVECILDFGNWLLRKEKDKK